MWILLWAISPALGCSCGTTPFRTVTVPDGDGVPTNPRLYGFVSYDREQVNILDHSVGAFVVAPDGDEIFATSVDLRNAVDGAVIVADLERELEPNTEYEVHIWGSWDEGSSGPPPTFRTGSGPDHDLPSAPNLRRVARGTRQGGCGRNDHVTLGVDAEENALLTVRTDRGEWTLLPGTTSWKSTFCRPNPVPRDAARVVIEDAAGNSSEPSEVVEVTRSLRGCTSSGGAWNLTWAPMLVLLGFRRRGYKAGRRG